MSNKTDAEIILIGVILSLAKRNYPYIVWPDPEEVKQINLVSAHRRVYVVAILEKPSYAFVDLSSDPSKEAKIEYEDVYLVDLPALYGDRPVGYRAGYSWRTNTLILSILRG